MLTSRFFRPLPAVAFLLAGLLFVGAGPLRAQQVRTITFDEAVQIALSQNIDLKKAKNSVDVQASTVARERADFLPNLNLSVSPRHSFGLTFDQTAFRQVNQSSQSASFNLSSGVTLFDGFSNFATLERARASLSASDYTLDRQQQTVIFSVVGSFLQVILDKEQVGIQRENLESQQQQLVRIREFTEVGTRPISDLYQQEASAANAELQLLNAEQAVELSKLRLLQVLELDPLGYYEFAAPTIEELQLLPESYNLDQLLQSAYDRRYDLKAQESQIEVARQGIRISRSGYMPRVSLSFGYGTSFSSSRQQVFLDPVTGSASFRDSPFGNQFRDNRSGSVGLNLSIPVFDRLQTRSAIEQSRVQYINAQLDLQNLEQSVALNVRQAYIDYETAIKRLEVTAKQVRSAEQAREVEQQRYNVGASTLVELTQANATYVQAASQRAQAVFRFLFQGKIVEYYQGVLDPSQTLFR